MTMPDDDFPAVWNRAIEALDAVGVTRHQKGFVRLTRPLGLLDGTALVAAPNDFTKDVLEQRLREQLVQVLSAELGQPVRLAVTVDPGIVPPSTPVPAGDQGELPGFDAGHLGGGLSRDVAAARSVARSSVRDDLELIPAPAPPDQGVGVADGYLELDLRRADAGDDRRREPAEGAARRTTPTIGCSRLAQGPDAARVGGRRPSRSG